LPNIVQTEVVCELKLTVKPELAVALTVKGAVPKGRFGSTAKEIVWAATSERVIRFPALS
jgi:hypothetical protein